jgi:hypothetical protein
MRNTCRPTPAPAVDKAGGVGRFWSLARAEEEFRADPPVRDRHGRQ